MNTQVDFSAVGVGLVQDQDLVPRQFDAGVDTWAVQPKLIYSRSAPQTLTYVVQGEVDAGIMFTTDAVNGGEDVKVVEISDPSWHSEIAYVTAVVSASEARTLGQAFIDFVTGPEGRAILERYGFLVP